MSIGPEIRTQRGTDATPLTVEASDAPAGKLGLAIGALIGALLLLCAAVGGLMLWFDRGAPPIGALSTLRPPEPRLQAREPDQRHAIEAAAQAHLAGLDEAMRRTVAAGWEDGR